MKIKWDQHLLKYSFYAILTLFAAIAFYRISGNLDTIAASLKSAGGWLQWLLSPFLVGLLIAYFLNPAVRWFEHRLFKDLPPFFDKSKRTRKLSIFCVYLILFSLLFAFFFFVVPQILSNIQDISKKMPQYLRISENFLTQWLNDIEVVDVNYLKKIISDTFDEYALKATQFLEENVSQLLNKTISFTAGLVNILLGIIISLYMLIEKDSFRRGAKKIGSTLFSPHRYQHILNYFTEVDELFGRYIVGKTLDSFIIGVLCFIGLSFLNVRYVLLLSVLVAITNMIPYFGPFIGMIPAGILTFFYSPISALWVVLFIFALQQFDGLFLGPKILGSSVGLPAFWIIFAIIIGGRLAGILGMLIAVPVFGGLWILVTKLYQHWSESQMEEAQKIEQKPLE